MGTVFAGPARNSPAVDGQRVNGRYPSNPIEGGTVSLWGIGSTRGPAERPQRGRPSVTPGLTCRPEATALINKEYREGFQFKI